jgi:hypothetical protein
MMSIPTHNDGQHHGSCIIIGERAAEALRTQHKFETSSVSRSARA